MKYKQIKPKKIYEQVADELLSMIREGKLKPGEKLSSVTQLAENFQVGRSAIREALATLRAMGLVEMKQGEGTYVKAFEPEEIVYPLQHALLMSEEDRTELMEVRHILETGIAASAALNRSDEDLVQMEQALAEMKEFAGDPEKGEKADLAFHMTIAHAAQNKLLLRLMHHVSDLTGESMRETRQICLFGENAAPEELNKQHEAILDAIRTKQPEQARLAMVAHLEYVEGVLRNYME
ncbi:FadR/GntR family transcriptional regulator [Terribacillus saccharophilus]|uniref:GntR family transcriptional regulator n=1 Tax=Terribacillus saccharophilus TaxID=361277 RepID=A0ABX4GUX1_9BACI|nr:FadR/GntR family transcriptional regulator [Terribacillus saccharophilus]PAD34328.1 GntR family transcriptional regulator [Terribacillus saccharophilus]PAD94906.1 GntR family transcriptional regulator [Terribacillus saccharophilus]PAD98655.1 GntR family transcriptional regulator [Terribacillus saccharophilus]